MKQATLYATYDDSIRETEKAILLPEFGWLPKSQIIRFESPTMGKMIAMPGWLKMKLCPSGYLYGRKCFFPTTKEEIELKAID